MGESRVEDYNYIDSSESRSVVRKAIKFYSSESRDDYVDISSESHDYDFGSSSSSTYDVNKIDELIETLEDNMPIGNRKDKRFNELYEHRKRQIAELRKLREESAKEAVKAAYLNQIEEDNDEIDNIISSIKNGRK